MQSCFYCLSKGVFDPSPSALLHYVKIPHGRSLYIQLTD